MKKKLLLIILVSAGMAAHSQVKVGDNPTTINQNSVLEVESTNKGMLLPRVALTGTANFAPLTAHVAGMTVYNTATAGDVTPGYYYNDGGKWVRLASNTAKNGLTRDVDAIKLGGTLSEQTTINTDATNNLVVNATGIGGSNVEDNQGLNVLATSISNSTAKAVALRGRIAQESGSIGQARGVSGAATITGGTVAGTATGGYFNTNISGTTLPATNGLMTGIAADAEATGANTNDASNTFAGARFGADVTAAPTTHSAGVVATAVGSSASNVGIAASATTDAATLTGKVNALPAGTNVANYSYAPAGAKNFASYSDGNVVMKNLPTGAPSNNLLVINSNGVVQKISTAGIVAGSGLDLTNDAWVNVTGAGARVELGTLADGTTARPAGTEFVALDNGKVGIATTTPATALQVTGGATPLEWGIAVSNTVADNTIKYGYIKSPAYNTSNPPLMGLVMKSTATESRLEVGGLSNTHSAPTDITFVTDNDNDLSTPLGTVRARIDGNGNFAIGNDPTVNNPTNRLHVQADANPLRLEGLQAGAATDQILSVDVSGVVRTINPSVADLRLVGTGNHISQDAGVGSNGTSAGTGYSNIIIGNGNTSYPAAGNSMTSGYRNIFLGETVGNANTTGFRNTIVGAPSFTANTTGNLNTAFGNSTLRFNNGDFNTVLGTYTMNQNTTGSKNTAIGANALYENKTGDKNTALGWRALGGGVAGSSNIGVGYNTGINVGGSNNIIIGNSLEIQNTSASNQLNIGNILYATGVDGSGTTLSTGNVGIGEKAPSNKLHVTANANPLRLSGLQAGAVSDNYLTVDANGVVRTGGAAAPADLRNVGNNNHITQDAGVGSNGTSAGTGIDNIAIGSGTGNALTTGEKNVFVGTDAGKLNSIGNRNTGIGMNALPANTIGIENSGIGYGTLRSNTTGRSNAAIGGYAMQMNTEGTYNTSVGHQSLYANTTGSNNVAIGHLVLGNAKSGNNNIGIGESTGNNINVGSNNIIIGTKVSIQNGALDNQLNIGNLIYATGLGSGNILSTGNVGIGKKAPNSRLAVVGLPVFADNVAAKAAGSGALTAGDFYRTADGTVKVVY